MTNQHRPVQPETELSLKPMLDAIYLIALLAAGSGLSDVIIKGLGL